MEWIKLHLSWADGLKAMTDENDEIDEAACGRFLLGLLSYIETGEKPKAWGAEKVLLAMAIADLKKDYAFFEKNEAERKAKEQQISDARREAANIRWGKTAETVQNDANASTSTAQQSNDEQTNQGAANKDIRSKNKDIRNREKNNKKRMQTHAVTESRYDQRENQEPDGDAIPQWLQDYQTEITGYSDPAGDQDAPDRPDIHEDEDFKYTGQRGQ